MNSWMDKIGGWIHRYIDTMILEILKNGSQFIFQRISSKHCLFLFLLIF